MDPTRWTRIAELFLEVVDLDPSDRVAHLDAAGLHPDARREIEAMLAAHEPEGSLAIEGLLEGARATAGLGPLPPGTILGRWALGPVVGEGGMGEVYRAERIDGAYEQTVAVKVLRPGFLAAEAVRRFRRERQLLARLTHPDIVPILDGGTAPDGRPYLVLHFVDGLPITTWCDERGLGLEGRLRLFQRVAEAVQFAHGRLVVHRDLKPSNILVQDDGSPRLLDFGIAKILDPEEEGAGGPTRPELRVLTPEHAAPEQLRGEPSDAATDVYGLGVLLYELVAGRRPFPSAGRTTEELTRTILTQPVPLPSAVATGAVPRHRLRGDLDRIVAMALRKERERRYRSAGELAEDVERFLRGLPVRARPDTPGYRLRKFVGRNRFGVGVAAGVALLVAGFAVTASAQARRIAEERDRAEGQRAAAEEVVGILTSLFQRSNPRLVPGGDTLPVAVLVDEAEARVAALEGEPERQLALWRAVGALRTARGEYARARELLEEAWTAHGDEGSIPERDRINVYHEYAVAVMAVDGPTRGRPMLEESLRRHRALLGEDHPDVAVILTDLAGTEADPARRGELLAEARRIRALSVGEGGVGWAGQLNAEGTALFLEGRYAEALARFETSLAVLEGHLPPEHPDRLTVSRNVAASLSSLTRWEEAEGLLWRIRELEEVASSAAARANTAELLGVLLAHQRRYGEAETALLESLELARDSAAYRLPNTYRNVGLLLGFAGRPDQGLALLDSALVLAAADTSTNPARTPVMEGQRALLLLELGRIGEGRVEAEAAARRIGELLPPTHPHRAEAEVGAGTAALLDGDPAAAEAWFSAAQEGARLAWGPEHPAREVPLCALAVVRARTGRLEEATADLEAPCDAMVAWGIAPRALERAAAEARQVAGVQLR